MDRRQLLNDSEEAQRLVLDGRLSTLWTAMPCIVTAVDFTDMTLSAQPTIQGTIEDEFGRLQSVNYPLLIKVPIVYPSAGGFTITFPIEAGDEVLVIFAARCIDAWWQSGGINRPMEARMHDLSDGFAIPGPRSKPRVVPSISSTALQIRNDAGTSYVEISASGQIKLVAPTGIQIDGNLSVDGNILATGEVTANSETVPIGLATHRHSGVTTGGGTSGGPVP